MSARNNSGSDTDSESAVNTRNPPRRFNRRAFSRMFVHLEKRLRAAPSKNVFAKLRDTGRAKVIAFTKNHTSAEMDQLLRSHFPTLGNLDLSCLSVISSYDRGHSMSTVYKGVPNGEKIMELFGGDAKKKIYLHWSGDLTSPSQSNTATVSSASSQTSSLSTSTPLSPSAQHISPTSQPPLSPPPASTQSSSQATDATHLTSNALPRGGGETRRYLSALAQGNSDGADTTHITISESDDDDIDLLHARMGHDMESIPTSPGSVQGSIATNPQSNVVISQSGGHTITVTQVVGCRETPFCEDGTCSGTLKEDFFPHGLGGSFSLSRTDEVIRCQSALQGSCIDKKVAMMPFVNHSFEEICWQAKDTRRPIVVVLVNPYSANQSKESMLRFLQKIQEEGKSDWIFWAAEISSPDGSKALGKYGNGREDQVIFLVPSTQEAPIFVDRIEGADLNDFNRTRLYEQIKLMIQGLNVKRDQLTCARQQQKSCKHDLEDMGIPEEAATTPIQITIRDARRRRVTEVPDNGVKVILRIKHTDSVIGRRFKKGAMFQEVYDWAGSLDDVPLHFTIQNGDSIMMHDTPIADHCARSLVKRGEKEAALLLSSQVSFKGNLVWQNAAEDLSDTLVDAPQSNEAPSTSGENKTTSDFPSCMRLDAKRKRVDPRTNKERRKNKKTRRSPERETK